MTESKSKIKALLGPTNTGKTYHAFERMLAHDNGMMGFPLRLLARENYDRAVEKLGRGQVALITGEEKIIPERARYYFCTVESMPVSLDLDFVAIDEIQLCTDPERGHIFTDRLLNARGFEETIFIGSDVIAPMLKKVMPDIEIIDKARLSELRYVGYKKLTRLPPRTAIIAFSVDDVYAIAEIIRRQKGGTAIVLGALSPRTRNAQVALYQNGSVDYLVATDAIGMGLNLDIGHIAFARLRKYDGKRSRPLDTLEIAQIAGRAGRYKRNGTFGVTGQAGEIDETQAEAIQNHSFMPIDHLYWRQSRLNFKSLKSLIQSLEDKPEADYLRKGRPATDYLSLKKLSLRESIQKACKNPDIVRLLWECCQIPDFRQILNDDHITFIENVFFFRLGDHQDACGRIPDDWVAARLKRLDRLDGTIDSLMNRLAHIRTWRYVANQADWLYKQQYWRDYSLDIEDRLSDALHEKLATRFVNKESSLLLKRMKTRDQMDIKITDEKEIFIGDMALGQIKGFDFEAYAGTFEEDKKTLIKGVRPSLMKYFENDIAAMEKSTDALNLMGDAIIQYKGESIARLVSGQSLYEPGIVLLQRDFLNQNQIDRVRAVLKDWIETKINSQLGAILTLENPDEKGLVSGILFRLFENKGWVERRDVANMMSDMDLEQKGILKKKGVYLGAFSIYHKALLDRKNQELITILWNVYHPEQRFKLLDGGHTSFALKNDAHADYAARIGFMPLGKTAVRLDMLERLNSMLYEKADKGIVELTNEMVNMIGIDFARAHKLLGRMGFKGTNKEKRLYRLPSAAGKQSDKKRNPNKVDKYAHKKKNRDTNKGSGTINNPFAVLKGLKQDMAGEEKTSDKNGPEAKQEAEPDADKAVKK